MKKEDEEVLIEQMYWSIVENGDRHVAVNYGSDIDTTVHGRY
jgi:hypothetical protein